jgi:hypothetical protein
MFGLTFSCPLLCTAFDAILCRPHKSSYVQTLRRTIFYINAHGVPAHVVTLVQQYTAETAPIADGHRRICMQLLQCGKPVRALEKVAPNIQVNVPLFELVQCISSSPTQPTVEEAILDSGYIARCERKGVKESLPPAPATPRVLTSKEVALLIGT